jgi:hypothetical protein
MFCEVRGKFLTKAKFDFGARALARFNAQMAGGGEAA